MESTRVEFKADDGKYNNSEEDEEPDLKEGRHSLYDGLENHLQAWEQRGVFTSERRHEGKGGEEVKG